jgi:hypothetical protein
MELLTACRTETGCGNEKLIEVIYDFVVWRSVVLVI